MSLNPLSMAKRNGRGISRMHFKDASVNDMTTHFNYPEVVGKHYDYCGCVDDHNNKRQDGGIKEGLALEVAWNTMRWPIRVFCFILAISEVNVYLAWLYFKGQRVEFLAFRKKLAHELIDNPYVENGQHSQEARNQRKRLGDHSMETAPKNARKWTGSAWDCSAKAPYQQFICSTPNCKKQVRTYCRCSPGRWRCGDCMMQHAVEEVVNKLR
mmetsp:Transcript_11506/g.20907  ORF Transcript_11506/g.20907 Transcript_11506/m.20907 type:complete len:212 (+) Transcript_11506:366-1001(+)